MSLKKLTWKLFNIGLIFATTLIATVSFFAFHQFGPDMDINVLKGISVIGLSVISILSTRLFLNSSLKIFQITVSLFAYLACLIILGIITEGTFGIQISIANVLFIQMDSIIQGVIGFVFILLMAGYSKKVRVTSGQRQNPPRKQNNLSGKLNLWAFFVRIKDAISNVGFEIKAYAVRPFIFFKNLVVKLKIEVKKLTNKWTEVKPNKRQRVANSNKSNAARLKPKSAVKNKPSTQMKPVKSLKVKSVSGKKDVSISRNQINKKKASVKSKPQPTKANQKINVQQKKSTSKAVVNTRKSTPSRNNHRSVLRFLGLQHSQVQLSKEVENRCPFCLEVVEENDPRGIVICPVCHTHHHADCWEVTGTCQVPHKHV